MNSKNNISVSLIFFLLVLSFQLQAQEMIKCEDAKLHMGKTATVCGKIFSGAFLQSSKTKPTLLNMGGTYPNQMLTVMIPLEYRNNFTIKPEEYFMDKEVCVTGKIIDYKGNPEIIITSPSELVLKSEMKTTSIESEKTIIKPVDPIKSVLPETPPTQKEFVVTLTNAVNVRSQPSNTSSILAVAIIGTKVIVKNSENGWSSVGVEIFNKALNKTEIFNGYIKNNVLK